MDTLWGTIPESVFQMFQLTFAIITPALIVGAFAERMKFSAMMLFMALWVTFVYAPVANWVWGGGFLGEMGILDFAGGTVVHINAGTAALVLCIMLGKRSGFPGISMAPNSLVLTVVGASMLWVGWFGFNAGSQLAADGVAGMAMAVTHISTAMAAFTWMLIEWSSRGKPSVVGIATGAVAGLVAITPASGFVGPVGALVIGLSAGVLCYWGANGLKRRFGYDDSLDVFGVHGIGGIVGALLTWVFASSALGGSVEGLNIGSQLGTQAVGVRRHRGVFGRPDVHPRQAGRRHDRYPRDARGREHWTRPYPAQRTRIQFVAGRFLSTVGRNYGNVSGGEASWLARRDNREYPAVFEGGATPPGGMHRRPNATVFMTGAT